MHRIRLAILIALLAGACAACKPEVGSDAWCKAMRDKPRGEWTLDEATDFAKSCILK
ncbi:MAG TPA: DUF3012 domain-containing protein [Gammaproteobacteria bacterium]|nr:DUF3012 domain-containing protein [Gammaproteobacteria bacterium]